MEQRIAPLPDPAELDAYKKIDPRLFDAIVEDFVENGKLRREIVRRSKRLDEKVIPWLVLVDLAGLLITAGIIGAFLFVVLRLAGAGGDTPKIISLITAALIAIPSAIKQFRGSRVRIKESSDDE